MRVSSATMSRSPSATPSDFSGTLKSTRTRTFFPDGSTSRIVRFANPGTPALRRRWNAKLGCDERRDVGEPAGVAPLVVVPGDDLHHVAEDEHGHGRRRHAERHAGELALERGDDEGDRLGRSGLARDDVLGGGARVAWLLRRGVERPL